MPSPLPAIPKETAIAVIFLITYLGIALGRVPGLKLNRTGIALLGAIGVMVFSGLTTTSVVSLINWPTLLLLFSFFVLSAQLRLSGFFDKVAAAISSRLGHPAWFLLLLMSVTAGLSAFLNHDIVCFVFAPVVGATLVSRKVNPVPFLIALAISSNIGAAATLVGNPQNMLIGQIARLHFGEYLLWCIVPVLFALGCAYGLIWMLSRHDLELKTSVSSDEIFPPVPFSRGHTIKGLMILVFVIALFFTSIPKEITALTAAGIHLASRKFRTEEILKRVDWSILLLFISLFVVNGAFQGTGLEDKAVQWLAQIGVNLETPVTLTIVTTGLSNLISNSATVVLLMNAVDLTNPTTAYVLALANSFGGSLVILGSVSNIIVVQQAHAMGIEISFRDFVRIGLPVTLAATAGILGWVALMG